MKGMVSPHKGKTLGPYSEERKRAQKEKMQLTKEKLLDSEIEIQRRNRSDAHKGKVPWNKGLTKETNEIVKQYSESKIGKSRPDMVGKTPWNKGKKCPELGLTKRGRPAHNKGMPSGAKGLTYEEIYGPEKAKELKEKRRIKKLEYWASKKFGK